MKINITKESLTYALRKTLSVVNNRAVMPILNNLLIEAKGEKLLVTASDMDITISCEVSAIIEEAGVFTVPAKIFDKIINDLPQQDIIISSEDNIEINIICGRGKWKLSGIDWTDFPIESDFVKSWGFTINSQIFKRSLNKVFYSRSLEETRKVLTGILLSIREGIISFAATDSRRLALVELNLESEETIPDGDVLLPAKTVTEILRVFDDNESVNVCISENRISFTNKNITFLSKMLDGTYPNFRQVIPKQFSNEVTIPRDIFNSTLNRVSIILANTTFSVDLKLTNDNLDIYANTSNNEASETISVIYQGEPINISFNPEFLSAPLKYLECENLIVQFNDEFSPIALRGDEGFIYIIMPMHH